MTTPYTYLPEIGMRQRILSRNGVSSGWGPGGPSLRRQPVNPASAPNRRWSG